MPTTIQIQYSATPGADPTTLDLTVPAELAVNVADGQLYTRDAANNIRKLGGSTNIDGDTTFEGDLTVEGDTILNNNVTIGGNTIIEGNLTVNGDTIVDGGSSVRAYKYWRMVNAEAASNQTTPPSTATSVTLDEIELLEDLGDSSVAIQEEATITSTSPDFGNPVTQLNNGIVDGVAIGTSWDEATVSDPEFFIQWEFADPRRVVALRQYAADDSDPPASTYGYFGKFEIQASDDGVNWLRTFYVTSQYDPSLNPVVLPYVAPDTWSAYYWLTDVKTIPEAPADGTTYGRQDETWVPVTGGGDWTYDTDVKTESFTADANTWHFVNPNGPGTGEFPNEGYNIAVTPPADPEVGTRFAVSVVSWTHPSATNFAYIAFNPTNGNKWCGGYPSLTSASGDLPLGLDRDMGGFGERNIMAVGHIYMGEDIGWVPLFEHASGQPIYDV